MSTRWAMAAELGALLSAGLLPGCLSASADEAAGCELQDFKTDGSIGVKWNAASSTLAYGRPNGDGSFKVFLSDLEGGNEQALTFPEWGEGQHQFPVEWHPSGKYLFVLVEKPEHEGTSNDAIPGYGAYTDLWVVTPDGQQAWKLVDEPNDYDHALTHMAIDGDGTKISWTERVKAPDLGNPSLYAGSYVFNTADFVDGPDPALANIVPRKPGDVDQGGEVDGMSADGNVLAFYSTYVSKDLFSSRIYTWDLTTDEILELSEESFSQAPDFTSDEGGLVYMSGQEADIFPGEIQGADWWYVARDGSSRQRLTYMNKWGHAHSVNHYRLAGTITFVDERTFLGDVLTFPLGLQGKIVRVSCSEL